MSTFLLPLDDLPESGQDTIFAEQAAWTDPIHEFHLPYEVVSPFRAELMVQAQGSGYLIQGHVTGSVSLPCDRCAELYQFEVDTRFELFEEPQYGQDVDGEGGELLRMTDNGLELDLGDLLWEQFLLALPVKPLCDLECAGICPQCGQNLNQSRCECDQGPRDPRLDIFRKLQINKGT